MAHLAPRLLNAMKEFFIVRQNGAAGAETSKRYAGILYRSSKWRIGLAPF